MKRILIFIYLIVIISGCELFEYHPYEVIVEDEHQDLNAKNIQKVQALPTKDTLRIALFGDTQRFYEETNMFVKKVNSMPDIDFAVLAGDITDFGLNLEYQWVNEIINDLNVPYLTVIGNHDLIANGQRVYEEMYGPMDFQFEYDGYKFIFLNTNSREFSFNGRVPDLPWLNEQFNENEGSKKLLVFSHIPPYSKDFDKELEMEYASMLAGNGNVLASLHAHHHSFEEGEFYDDGIYYYITSTVGKRAFALITLFNEEIEIEQIRF